MNKDGVATKILASKLGPKYGHNEAHQEDYNRFRGICNNGSKRNRWSGDHGAVLCKILCNASRKGTNKRAIDLSMTIFNNGMVALTPFWHKCHYYCVANTLAKKSER